MPPRQRLLSVTPIQPEDFNMSSFLDILKSPLTLSVAGFGFCFERRVGTTLRRALGIDKIKIVGRCES